MQCKIVIPPQHKTALSICNNLVTSVFHNCEGIFNLATFKLFSSFNSLFNIILQYLNQESYI